MVLTLGFDAATFARLAALRDRYFPPERNLVPAHLSLLHQLPGAELAAVRARLTQLAGATPGPLPLRFGPPRQLGNGVCLPVDSPPLKALLERLKDAFGGWVIPQDRQPFRPHVTLQNKATRAAIDRALTELMTDHESWSGDGTHLLLWHYRGGPWEAAGEFPLGL